MFPESLVSIPKTHWGFVPACSKRQWHFVIARGDASWRVQGYWCRRLRFTRHLELVITVGAACHELPASRLFVLISIWIDWSQNAGSCRILESNCSFALVTSFCQPCTDTSRSFPMWWGCQTPETQDPSSQSSHSKSIRLVEHHRVALTSSRRFSNHLNDR